MIRLPPKHRPKTDHLPPSKWKVPKDMHPRLVKLVLEGKACGARCANDRGYCTQRPALTGIRRMRKGPPPYRCRWHGGLGGAPVGNQNARKTFGIYAECLTPEEENLADKIVNDDLTHEINILRAKMFKCIQLAEEQQLALRSVDSEEVNSAFDPVEKTIKMVRPEGRVWLRKKNSSLRGAGRVKPTERLQARLVTTEVTVVRRARDYMAQARDFARILGKLLAIQKSVSGDEGSMTDNERATNAARLLREAKMMSGVSKEKPK